MNKNIDSVVSGMDTQFKYMLLDRMKQDCRYFLGNGDGNVKNLWAGDIELQIKYMKCIYNSLVEKPEWISLDDISIFEKAMLYTSSPKTSVIIEYRPCDTNSSYLEDVINVIAIVPSDEEYISKEITRLFVKYVCESGYGEDVLEDVERDITQHIKRTGNTYVLDFDDEQEEEGYYYTLIVKEVK